MTIWQAAILGLVQGLGEFLPISSSAHLVLIPWICNWPDPGLTFDIALHVGTLISLIAYFWKDWLKLIQHGVQGASTTEGKLFWFIAAASVPGAAIGFLLEHKAETIFRTPALIAGMLIVMGAVLFFADRKGAKNTDLVHINFTKSLLIGISQAFAILPGVSRSGVTMTAGLLAGLTREAATRFSFLLSAPIVFGAAVAKIPNIVAQPDMITTPFLIGLLVAACSGFASIKVLLAYVQQKDFTPFVWYRFVVGVFVLALCYLR